LFKVVWNCRTEAGNRGTCEIALKCLWGTPVTPSCNLDRPKDFVIFLSLSGRMKEYLETCYGRLLQNNNLCINRYHLPVSFYAIQPKQLKQRRQNAWRTSSHLQFLEVN
jgi:hypothetical protein